MAHAYGKESLSRLAKECGFGASTSTRLKQQETYPGIDTVDQIATRFQFSAWQILVPGFDPKNPPVLFDASAAVAATPEERALLQYYRSLPDEEDRQAFLRAHRIGVEGKAESPMPADGGPASMGRAEARRGDERRKRDRRSA